MKSCLLTLSFRSSPLSIQLGEVADDKQEASSPSLSQLNSVKENIMLQLKILTENKRKATVDKSPMDEQVRLFVFSSIDGFWTKSIIYIDFRWAKILK